jgi:hypothetical protein
MGLLESPRVRTTIAAVDRCPTAMSGREPMRAIAQELRQHVLVLVSPGCRATLMATFMNLSSYSSAAGSAAGGGFALGVGSFFGGLREHECDLRVLIVAQRVEEQAPNLVLSVELRLALERRGHHDAE